jgi:uncharacterized membrane protein YdbT with pleckstrin-like domain
MSNGAVVIHKVWRSEIVRVVIFFVLCIAAVLLSRYFPRSIITGELIRWGETRIDLDLPLFALMPMVAFGDLIARVYDVRYTLDEHGIEGREGIVSLSQSIIRLRYEDIRMVEFDQSLIERALDIGDLQVGTASSAEVELIMRGIASPREVQLMIQRERERRMAAASTSAGLERVHA